MAPFIRLVMMQMLFSKTLNMATCIFLVKWLKWKSLTHLKPLMSFDTPWKHKNTKDFLKFFLVGVSIVRSQRRNKHVTKDKAKQVLSHDARGEWHIQFCIKRIIMTQARQISTHYNMCNSQNFEKIDSFLKPL